LFQVAKQLVSILPEADWFLSTVLSTVDKKINFSALSASQAKRAVNIYIQTGTA
jgi:hypothetical protein